ncbi:hypothetical protein PROFUN_11151 [Planoprotostelium fungivorum]|uniref:Heme haloperoxidase family profile domain-containing protein n=1 Tax=Planoprotostelium fungivorum TaxID=1890364 RepID=A0A2P6NAN4_9EUKA|nr:hypothetical protein PROFUN_11151 [Planoprotostelium fungivorum]
MSRVRRYILRRLFTVHTLVTSGQWRDRECRAAVRLYDCATCDRIADGYPKKAPVVRFIKAHKAVKPGATAIDLHDLALHNGIQHDAALTRNDMGQGEFYTRVNMTLVKQLTQMNNGGPVSYLEMARLRRLREGQSEAWNSNYTLPGQDSHSVATNKWFLAIDQAAVPLLVLSDNIPYKKENTGVVPIDRLLTFFQFERLPYENGWVPSQYELSGSQIFDGIKKTLSNHPLDSD